MLMIIPQVLRFYGFFKEAVVESNIENHRVRKVIIYYYLEDDSMHIAEPHQDNSGIPQVCREDGGPQHVHRSALSLKAVGDSGIAGCFC